MANVFGDSRNPLEEINLVFSSHEDSLAAAKDWALKLLDSKGIDPVASPLTAIKAIRDEEKAIGLKTATYLVEKLSK